jgi:hypothetical protein
MRSHRRITLVVCSWVAMNTVSERALVVNSHRQRAAGPLFLPRRAHFNSTLALAVTFLLCSNLMHAQKRREAILRLREDVSTAMAHASLSEKQTQKLDHCRQTLLLAAQSGRIRSVASKRDLDGAVRDIQKLFQSGPFQPDDRDLVRQDIEHLHAIQRSQRTRRARPM